MDIKEKIAQQYTGRAGEKYHEALNIVPDKAYLWVARLRRDKINAYVQKTDTVLEVGVGTGWNLAELKCKKRLGYDLSTHLKSFLNEKGIEFVENISSVPDDAIDAVVCHHVLEHTADPLQVLKQIYRILRKNGKLILFVPYEKGRAYHRYNPDDPNNHIFSWNPQTLGALVEKSGFRVQSSGLRKFGYDRFASVWALKLNLGESGFRILRNSIHIVKPVSEVCIIAAKA